MPRNKTRGTSEVLKPALQGAWVAAGFGGGDFQTVARGDVSDKGVEGGGVGDIGPLFRDGGTADLAPPPSAVRGGFPVALHFAAAHSAAGSVL